MNCPAFCVSICWEYPFVKGYVTFHGKNQHSRLSKGFLRMYLTSICIFISMQILIHKKNSRHEVHGGEDEYVVVASSSSKRPPYVGTRGEMDWEHVITDLQPFTSYHITLTLKAAKV